MSLDAIHKRWSELTERGEYGPNPCTQDPYRAFVTGYLEGRTAELLRNTNGSKIRRDALLGCFILGGIIGATLCTIINS